MSRRTLIAEKIAARSHYEDRGYRDPETGEPSLCRIWDGPTSGDASKTRGHGYGRMNLDAGTVAVHIAAWVNENGLIPPRKQLDHLCHQRDCSEERHLRLKTHLQNQRNKKPKTNAEIQKDFESFCEHIVGKEAKMGTHGEIGPTGRRGTPNMKIVDVDMAHIEQRVVAHMVLGDMPEYGGTTTGRWSSGVSFEEGQYTDQIIGHDIPADRLPPAAAEVTDE